MEKKVDIIARDQGVLLPIAGGSYRIIVSTAQTDGEYAIIEMNVPPGGGPNPHRHRDFEETFFILEGEVEFTSLAGTKTARAGDLVRIPKNGEVHCFKNTSAVAAKLLCTVVPAGLDEFFEQASEIAKSDPDTIPARLKVLAETYGQELFPPDYFRNKEIGFKSRH